MSDLKLFRIDTDGVQEIEGRAVALEKSLQQLMERNLVDLLGIRFLASEYTTGKVHNGRIDTLGIDENGSPVIIEYKRDMKENVINQGLFYLDWLLDHKAEFELLVMKTLGAEAAEAIDWSGPRLLCIAGDFTRYDEHAVKQMGRNIELMRYRKFGDELLSLDLVNAVSGDTTGAKTSNGAKTTTDSKPPANGAIKYTTVSEFLESADADLTDLYEQLKAFLLALGDDVQIKTLKFYFAFKRIKNFACVEIHPQARKLVVYVKADTSKVTLEEGFSRDVGNIGHFGTGNIELTIKDPADLDKAKPWITESYEAN